MVIFPRKVYGILEKIFFDKLAMSSFSHLSDGFGLSGQSVKKIFLDNPVNLFNLTEHFTSIA